MTARLEVHFEGDVVQEHKVTLRALGKTLNHLQSAIDRAHLDVRHGHVWKHARLKADDYALTEFLLNYPREGGFILDMVSNAGDAIAETIRQTLDSAVADAMEQGVEEAVKLRQQAKDKRSLAIHDPTGVRSFPDFQIAAEDEMDRAYGERSIAKEFDQILSIIRHEDAGESTLTISIEVNGQLKHFPFTRAQATSFHKAVSRRDLAEPVIYRGILRSLDKGNKYSASRGKFRNIENHREITIHIATQEDFDELHPYLSGDQEISIVAAPVIEYGSFDPIGGDIYFIGLTEALTKESEAL